MEDGYKACPFCAEPVRDSATICRYCNRSLGVVDPKRRPRTDRTTLIALLIALSIFAGVIIYVQKTKLHEASPPAASSPDGTSTSSTTPVSEPVYTPPPPPRPVSVKLLDENLEVDPGAIRYVKFRVPDSVLNHAKLSGSFHAFGGDGNDMEVAVADPSEFENWQNGHKARLYYTTENTTNGTVDLNLGPGDYVIGFSNRFSRLSRKEVTGEITLTYFVLSQ